MARARRASPPPAAILRSSSRAVRLLLLVGLLTPSLASASHPPDGGDASHSNIAAAAAAAAAADGGMADAGMGLGIADQFVSTEDLPAANAAVDAETNAARGAATDAAGQAEFDPKLAGVEEEERLVDELLTWLEERGVTGIRGEEAAVEVVIDANTTLKASGRSRANLCMVARRPIAEGEVFLSLPRSLAISALQAQEEAKPYEGEVHPFTALAAWVLRERGKGSASLWAPFLVPELQYDVMLAEVAGHKEALVQEYNKCRPEAIANATQEEFFWAAGIVTSRMFALRPAAAAEAEDKGKEGEGQGKEERQEAEISLVPYGDLFDTDDVPIAIWQDTGSSIEFMALTDIPAGQHVAVHYGELSNDEALVMRGMVLGGNYRDHMHLFSSPQDAVRYHVDKFLRGYGHTLERTPLQGTYERVEAELQKQAAAPQYAGVAQRFEYRMAPASPLSAWFGGRFDPRLLAIFTALHALVVNNRSACPLPSPALSSHAHSPSSLLAHLPLNTPLPACHVPCSCLACSYQTEPDLSHVAQVSLLYGWMKDPKSTCDDLARLVDDDVSDAVPPAGNVLVERGQQLLKAFPTTLGEDLKLWRQCGAEYVRELSEWEVILRYRMMKKYILRHLVGRLLHTCEN
ncbi:unnamed protein product [Closterium sp. Yama58-4]|nr:unnamed protein product [Closterium sp. Yama58-4]